MTLRLRALARDIELSEISHSLLIPLYEDMVVFPGGDLIVDCIAVTLDEPLIIAYTPATFITP